jgi:hypothetical protein
MNNTKDDKRWTTKNEDANKILQNNNKQQLVRVLKWHAKNIRGVRLDMLVFFFGQ